MKLILFIALLFASSGVFASQIISCGVGTSSLGRNAWAKVTIDGTKAWLQSNQNAPSSISESMRLAIRPNERQFANLIYLSDGTSPQNDSDFSYKISLSKGQLGQAGNNATLFVYSHSFMPSENGSSYSVKYTGCRSTLN